MLYLREAQDEVRRARLRALSEAATKAMRQMAEICGRIIDELGSVFARVAADLRRAFGPLLARWLTFGAVRAAHYGYTGPTLTGPELAHWRRHAGRPRRRQR